MVTQLGAEAQHSSEATAFAGSPTAAVQPDAPPVQQPADGACSWGAAPLLSICCCVVAFVAAYV